MIICWVVTVVQHMGHWPLSWLACLCVVRLCGCLIGCLSVSYCCLTQAERPELQKTWIAWSGFVACMLCFSVIHMLLNKKYNEISLFWMAMTLLLLGGRYLCASIAWGYNSCTCILQLKSNSPFVSKHLLHPSTPLLHVSCNLFNW